MWIYNMCGRYLASEYTMYLLSVKVLENYVNERSCRFKLKMFEQLMAFLEGFQCQQFIIFIIKLVVLREMISIMTNLMPLSAQTQPEFLGIIFMGFI